MRPPIRDLEARLIQAKTASECLSALLDLADAHADENRSLEGLRKAREALNIARVQRDTISIGRALAAAALCQYQRNDYLSAVATGLDAVEACADQDLAGRSSALQSVALALHAVKADEMARVTASHAVDDARRAHDTLREASARSVLGVVLSDMGLHKDARREFRGAAAAYRRGDEPARLMRTTANIGHTYRHQGEAYAAAGKIGTAAVQFKQARRVYEIALALAGSTDADRALVLGAIAECECRLGDHPAAQLAIESALGLGVQNPAVQAPCHLWHSRIRLAQHDLKGAERACEAACRAAQALEQGDLLAACLQHQSQLNDLQGRFETAHDLERRAQEVTLAREAEQASVREQLAQVWDQEALARGRGQAKAA